MQHDFKAVCFQTLWSEIFITDADDVERVNKVMELKGHSWSIAMTFNLFHITLYVKRTVPLPHML